MTIDSLNIVFHSSKDNTYFLAKSNMAAGSHLEIQLETSF